MSQTTLEAPPELHHAHERRPSSSNSSPRNASFSNFSISSKQSTNVPPSPSTASRPQSELEIESTVPSPAPAQFKSLWHELAFITVVTCAQLITQMNLGHVIVPIASIKSGLHLPASQDSSASWFVASYSCTVGAFVLVTGRLGDLYGRRNLFILGWLWLAVCNIAIGFCPSQIPFDILRALAGIGPSILMPNAAALLGGAWPDSRDRRDAKMKQIAFTCLGAIAPAGYVVGCAYGSAVVQLGASWRWIFWIMAILSAVLAVLSWIFVPNTALLNGKAQGDLDIIGSILGVSGLVLIFVALNGGGSSFTWHVAYTPILLILGLLSLLLFILHERRTAFPILPPSIFTNATFTAVAASLCLGWMSFGMFQFYNPQFLLSFRHLSPLHTSLQLLPCALIGLVAATLSVFLLPRVPGYVIFGASMLSFFAGQLMLALTPVEQSYWSLSFWTYCIICFGPDLSFACAALIASDKLPQSQQGVAGSFINTVVNYSIALGLALAGNLEVGVNGGGKTEEGVLRGFRAAYWLGAGFAAGGVVCTVVFRGGMAKRHKAD